MKPVAVIRFSASEQPGYLADYLNAALIPWQLIRIDAGESPPQDCTAYSGIAMMGGPMSVNDALPWLPPLFDLIRQSVDHGVPLLGHCLGGQMMAKAMGGEVTDNKCMEKGWHEVEVTDDLQARTWFGDIRQFTTFQWHYQTFSIPPDAVKILRNDYCENQAFAMGPHIGFQCHIEMTEAMVRHWCEGEAGAMATAPEAPSIQSVSEIQRDLAVRVYNLNRLAKRVYLQWTIGLRSY